MWIVLVDRMRGMDAGPGTDLGALGWFVGTWVTMTAAMMLPSAAPMTLVYARTAGGRLERTLLFLAGYLVAWTVYGLVAYRLFRAVRAAAAGFLAWDRGGPWIAGAALAAAGAYELTPLKASACGTAARRSTSCCAAGGRERPVPSGWEPSTARTASAAARASCSSSSPSA